jgi:polysaccharide biosynthesis protein PelD
VKHTTTPVVKATGILAFALIIGAINSLFFPSDMGFLAGFFNPYTAVSLFIAVYYGKYYGFLSLAASTLAVVLGLLLGAHPVSAVSLARMAALPLASSLVGVYVLGMVRDSLTRRDGRARSLLVSLSREKGLLKRKARALEAANRELEERLSRQRDSITSLYSQMQMLNSLNLSKAFLAILEMVRRFVGATRCSIWEHRPESKTLALASRLGSPEGSDTTTTLADDGSIEGWVVRNNTMFSVKMLLQNEALAKLDTGRAIMTLPISAGRRIWGVLTIEEMPFAKYNLYAERLLLVIMALARPMLERAIEFESVVRQEDTHPVTGLPSFPQFYAMLQIEFARLEAEKGTLAILIVELANFDELAEAHGKQQVFGLLRDLAAMAQEIVAGPTWQFHYKTEPQLALVCPNLDADGASLLSLTLLGKVNGHEWRCGDARVSIELVLGFAARSGGGQSADELMEAAERLLEMQKV